MYTKLFSSILNSSIWSEDSDTCKIWITLLVMMDREGFIFGSPAGIARISALPIETVTEALRKFALPDEYSADLTRDGNQGGRRVEVINGGWRVINANYYRDLQDQDVRRLRDNERKKRQRSRYVTSRHASSREIHHTDAESEVDSDTKAEKPPSVANAPGWSKEACDDWEATLGNPQGGRIGIALKPLVTKHGWEEVRPLWKKYLLEKDPKYASPSDFASKYEVWKSGGLTQPHSQKDGGLDGIRQFAAIMEEKHGER
jgi:hypothetical protein